MATSFKLKHFSNPSVLKQIKPILLLGLLDPFRDFLKSKDEQAIVGNVIDYDKLAAILMAPGQDMPLKLMEALFYIDETASIEDPDDILTQAAEYDVDLSAMVDATAADLAVAIWIKNPGALEAIHAEGFIVKTRKFDSFFSTSAKLPCYPVNESHLLKDIESDLDNWFEHRKRGKNSKIFQFYKDNKVWFLVRHGELFKRQAVLNEHGSGSIFYRPEKYDVLFYNPEVGELAIHSVAETDRIQYCKMFGKHLFGNEEFFNTSGREKYTLQPLRTDGRAALICSDVSGIEKISFTELQWRHNVDLMHVEIHKANDIFDAFAEKNLEIPKNVTLTKASFQIKFKDSKRPRTVTILPPATAIFSRESDEDAVNEWLEKRGFINETVFHEYTNGLIKQAVAIS
jgi:hypothetical protein